VAYAPLAQWTESTPFGSVRLIAPEGWDGGSIRLSEGQRVNFGWIAPIATVSLTVNASDNWRVTGVMPAAPDGAILEFSDRSATFQERESDIEGLSYAIAESETLPATAEVIVWAVGEQWVPFALTDGAMVEQGP